MDFPDDIPDNAAPAAVIRRQGESSAQMSARHAGFSDEQTGFGQPLGGGALARSYQVAHDAAMQARADTREAGTQGRFDTRQQLQQQEQALREKQFQNQVDTHAAALRDAHAIADEHASYINSITAAREKFGANTPDFYAAAWAAGAKAPNALAHDARLGEMQNFYGKALDASGAAPTLKTALWEVAQFDPTSNITPAQSRQYLGEIVAKYPEVSGDKRFVGLIAQKLKDVNMLDVPAGDTVKQTVTGPNGTTVTTIPPGNDAAELKSLQREQSLHTRYLSGMMSQRDRKGLDEDQKKALDEQINKGKADLAEVESRIKTFRQPSDSAPAKVSEDIHDAARNAIKAGADADAVKARLLKLGGDPSKL